MAIETKGLREDRAKLIADAQKIAKLAIDEKRSNTADEQSKIDAMLNDESRLAGDIERLEKLNKAEASLSVVRSTIGRENHGVAVIERASNEVAVDAFRSWIVNGEQKMPQDLYRALSVSANGTLAPAEVQTEYIKTLRNFTDIRQAPVRIISGGSGNDIPWPTWNGTSMEADAVDEGDDVGAADSPTTGSITLKSWMVSSGVFPVSIQFLQDNVVNAEQLLNEELAAAIAVKQNLALTTGNGTTEAQGIVTGAGVGITLATGHTAAIGVGADAATKAQNLRFNLNELIHSVKKVYRVRGFCGFMMNDNTAKGFKNYVTSTGEGLWQASLQADEPDMLLG